MKNKNLMFCHILEVIYAENFDDKKEEGSK